MSVGRPTKYDPEYPEKARKLFEQGCTDREVAEFFGVHETTLRNWSAEYPEFFMALKLGKAAADDRVEQSLYRRALGYSHDSVKILQNNGEPVVVPYVEHYPPDTTAGIFWLKNRRPDKWRDVKAVEHSGAVTHRHVNEFSDEELAAIAAGSGAGTADTADGPPEPSDLH
jgi:hypothetical protein